MDKKITLINLTLKSLEQEYDIIQNEPEFAQVCVSWISVKSYYILFNLLIIFRYLIAQDQSSFYVSHHILQKEIVYLIKRGDLKFSESKFNQVLDGRSAISLKIKAGANIRQTAYDIEERTQQILKKIEAYKEEDYRIQKHIKTIRKKKDKNLVMLFRGKCNINLIEFFYWYRIKANYRDLEFLNKKIAIDKFVDYYNEYYQLTQNFHSAFKTLINKMALVRYSNEIL